MPGNRNTRNLAVIGGGAAGFFGAVNAVTADPTLDITIFERSRSVLSKVRVSGGGRCNVTHHCYDPEILSRAYPRGQKELRWAFERFDAADTVDWFEDRGVKLKTEEDGRMFPVTDDSETIIHCLTKAARRYGITTRTKAQVDRVEPRDGNRFLLHLNDGNRIQADLVLVAIGGSSRRSYYQWLEGLEHSIVPPVPSLFTFNFREKIFQDLAGISVPNAQVTVKNSSFAHTGPVLITHWGLSGPAVLKTSAWAARFLNKQEYRFTIRVNWLYPLTQKQVREGLKQLRNSNARKTVAKQDHFPLPGRLWERLVELAQVNTGKRWAELSNRDIHEMTRQLVAGSYEIQGKTTYKEEFVTCGGISLDEVDFGTMQSKKCPGLYFAGEVLDIDAITGGYNFQAAWTTSWIAAQGIAGR
ncbi:MAG: NAD(P)/FAD-dependent oxidoreductase [Balneolaceae bacterium]|nr:NAD(P)/FAD-dependent oxidoreductase [Balneolaceae bacterium]